MGLVLLFVRFELAYSGSLSSSSSVLSYLAFLPPSPSLDLLPVGFEELLLDLLVDYFLSVGPSLSLDYSAEGAVFSFRLVCLLLLFWVDDLLDWPAFEDALSLPLGTARTSAAVPFSPLSSSTSPTVTPFSSCESRESS